jgi:hypothetical protein
VRITFLAHRKTAVVAALLTGLLAAASPLSAEIYILPEDRQMISQASAIAVGTVTGLSSEFDLDGGIVTNVDITPEIVLKGDLVEGEPFRLVEPGGVVGSQAMIVSAAPVYWVGNRALIFLTTGDDGSKRTWGAALGKFDFVSDAQKRRLLVRWVGNAGHLELWSPAGNTVEDRARDAERFLGHLQALRDARPRGVQSRVQNPELQEPGAIVPAAAPDYFVDNPAEPLDTPAAWAPETNAIYPPSAYTHGTFRWKLFDEGGFTTFRVSGAQPGYDSIGAAQRALAAWTNDSGSNVDYRYGGTSTAKFVSDDQNTIVYNSSADVPSGAVAYARWFAAGTHEYKGETFYTIVEGDVVVRSNLALTAKEFDEAVTHEVGHTLGLRHSDQGTPSSTQAVMKAVLSGNYGATLGPWDVEAVRTVYTSTGPAPLPPRPRYTFTDDPLVPDVTRIKALHLIELRNAINDLREAAGLSAVTWTDPSPEGKPVRAVHLTEMRVALTPALAAYGIVTTYSQAVTPGTLVRASHFQELRNYLK